MYLPRQAANTLVVGPVNLGSQGETILIITGCFTGLAALVVLARLYVRTFMLKTMGIDDYFMMVALVSDLLELG